MQRLILAAASLALATACADSSPADADVEGAEPVTGPLVATTPPPSPGGGATGPQGGTLVPQAIETGDMNAVDLKGELGCTFAPGDGEKPLLFASSSVDHKAASQAAVKLGGTVERLETKTTGGFDALIKGAQFTGANGLAADVVRTESKPMTETPQIAMESPRYSGRLVLSRAGQQLSIDGIWECGP
ncbi:hypothetical protein [Qipengyuania sp.]|uniref:hypothetical protein n=1 Tax=Qipengyuania sp. TaxID=2004515 RepID=UPI0035C7DD39